MPHDPCAENWDLLISRHAIDELDEEEETTLLSHLRECDSCWKTSENRKTIDGLLDTWNAPGPSRTRRDHALDRMKTESQRRHQTPTFASFVQTKGLRASFIIALSMGIIALIVFGSAPDHLATAGDQFEVELVRTAGNQIVIRSTEGYQKEHKPGTRFTSGDVIWTGTNSSAVLKTDLGDRIRLDEQTTLRIGSKNQETKRSLLYLQRGELFVESRNTGEWKTIFLTPSGEVEGHNASFHIRLP